MTLPTPSGAGGLSGMRFLIVDDNVGTATLLSGVLRDAGGTVDVLHSIDAAVVQAGRKRPAAVVVHLPAPRDAADAITQRLRKNDALAGTRIVVIASEVGAGTEALAGADLVLPRPFSPEHVLDAVGRLVTGAKP